MVSFTKEAGNNLFQQLDKLIRYYQLNNRCLAGRMAMHACQIGPTDTAPPCPGSPVNNVYKWNFE